MRKPYCSCDSNFGDHYRIQAGRGFSEIQVFRGQPYQRGYGIGSVLRRFGIPILKFLGKQLLKTGLSVGQDILSDIPIKESLKKRSREGAKEGAKKALGFAQQYVDQMGTGMQKRVYETQGSKKVKLY